MRSSEKIRQAISNASFDWLGRDSFINSFYEYIIDLKESTHICIDGVWGSGKSTTILGVIQKIEELDKEKKQIVIYLDAWKYEHYEHPLFSLLAVMKETVPDIMRIIQSELNSLTLTIQKGINVPFLGLNLSIEDSKSGISCIVNKAEYVALLNELMIIAVKKYKEEKGNELIIFIDELDRAKPDFAIRTLEMIHHLQDDLPTHVVYSVDMIQLNGIIKHYYGYEYNVEIFVHKIFDIVIPLQKLSARQLERYISNSLLKLDGKIDLYSIVLLVLKYMSRDQLASLRSVNKICSKIVDLISNGYFLNKWRRSDYYLGSNENIFWGYVELLVIFIALNFSNPIMVRGLFNSTNTSDFVSYLINNVDLSKNDYLSRLIRESYNFDTDETHKIDDNVMLNEEIIKKSIMKIINPPNLHSRGNLSVFSDF